MEIGVNSPFFNTGYILTHAFSKKFMDMLEGVPNDLMQWIVEYDQKYLSKEFIDSDLTLVGRTVRDGLSFSEPLKKSMSYEIEKRTLDKLPSIICETKWHDLECRQGQGSTHQNRTSSDRSVSGPGGSLIPG